MRSKKKLIITLVVGLAIFLISLIIGRPLWQALVLTMAFFLVSTVLVGTGLVIPEWLFGKRHSNSPQEMTSKENYCEKMDLMLADLSTQPGITAEDVKWMTEYAQVMKEVCELIYEVHESVRSKDRIKELRAFRGVTNELPHLISQLKGIPKLVIPERQEAIERQRQGLDLYLEACSDFIEALETSDGKLASQAAIQINEALKLLDLMDESQLV